MKKKRERLKMSIEDRKKLLQKKDISREYKKRKRQESKKAYVDRAKKKVMPRPGSKNYKEPNKEGNDHGTNTIISIKPILTPFGGDVSASWNKGTVNITETKAQRTCCRGLGPCRDG
jgi:hypothetical protein